MLDGLSPAADNTDDEDGRPFAQQESDFARVGALVAAAALLAACGGEEPQRTSGPGWRLLLDAPGVGPVYVTEVATNRRAYRELWNDLDLTGRRPPVDFAREIVIQFSRAVSGTCPDIRLERVVFGDGVVYPEIAEYPDEEYCTDDARAHTYVLAVARDSLPGQKFRVQLEPPPCICKRSAFAHVDLTPPEPMTAEERTRQAACVTEWNGRLDGLYRQALVEYGYRIASVERLEVSGWVPEGAGEPEPGESTAGCKFVFFDDETFVRFPGYWTNAGPRQFFWDSVSRVEPIAQPTDPAFPKNYEVEEDGGIRLREP